MKRIVILTGAGISKESGIDTFRDSKESLWNNHRVEDVATPMAFIKDPGMVLDFYNQRRRIVAESEPNQAHFDLVSLEDYYDVQIITQNIDDLHERAGSSNILHLHGSILESKTNMDPEKIHYTGYEDISLGDVDEDGYQLRPNVVWFGESITKINDAERLLRSADIYVIIGTSLEVYPASMFHTQIPRGTPVYLIDPNVPNSGSISIKSINFIQEPATVGVAKLVSELIEKALGDE
jgi:NAD-dependent deacetylase